MNTVRTTCPYCAVGCGIAVDKGTADVPIVLRGDAQHPANAGALCSKGRTLLETLPEVMAVSPALAHKGDLRQPVTWDKALDHVANQFRRIIAQHGPEAVAFYVSGQLLTEDYYVANKLAKGFIATPHLDSNSRLCMASAVAAYKQSLGADAVPCSYDDLDAAQLIVLVGSNTAWCHPIVFRRILEAKKRGCKVVVIDPRRTATAELADLHLPIAPESDVFLFVGLLNYLRLHNHLNFEFLESSVAGFGRALAQAEMHASIPQVAAHTHLNERDVAAFFALFGRNQNVVTLFSQGVNQSVRGTEKARAIIHCHLATGRIGRPGAGPFSITGQPNAMGGREVGALANQLAAHMAYEPESVDRVQRFWGTSRLARGPGYSATEIFAALGRGEIKAVWICATNPVVSLPRSYEVEAALRRAELVVVADCVQDNETIRLADVYLPALGWGEKNGTVTNSERCISRQRPFLPPRAGAKADWWMLQELAVRLGYGAHFAYRHPRDIFVEHARLSAFENDGQRAFDIGLLAELSESQYDALEPLQWPVTQKAPRGTTRLFLDGRFFTCTGKANMAPLRMESLSVAKPGQFVLNNGRIRDHWHTLTRTGIASSLWKHIDEPFVAMHPGDAESAGLLDGDLASVQGNGGRAVVRVRVDAGQRRGEIFVPMHWGGLFAAQGRVNDAVDVACDPISRQPGFKSAQVTVGKAAFAFHATVLSASPLEPQGFAYWARAKLEEGWRYYLAKEAAVDDFGAVARGLLDCEDRFEWLELIDAKARQYRAVCTNQRQVVGCFFASREPINWQKRGMATGFSRLLESPKTRLALLSGKNAERDTDTGGPVVCACRHVGRNTLMRHIADGATTLELLSARTGAGSGCGSCLGELGRLMREQQGADTRLTRSV